MCVGGRGGGGEGECSTVSKVITAGHEQRTKCAQYKSIYFIICRDVSLFQGFLWCVQLGESIFGTSNSVVCYRKPMIYGVPIASSADLYYRRFNCNI